MTRLILTALGLAVLFWVAAVRVESKARNEAVADAARNKPQAQRAARARQPRTQPHAAGMAARPAARHAEGRRPARRGTRGHDEGDYDPVTGLLIADAILDDGGGEHYPEDGEEHAGSAHADTRETHPRKVAPASGTAQPARPPAKS